MNKDYDFIVKKCDDLVSLAYLSKFVYPESVNTESEKRLFDLGVVRACNIIVNSIIKELAENEEQRKKTKDN